MATIKGLYQNLHIFYATNYKKWSLSNPMYNISPDGKTLSWYNYEVKQVFDTYEEYYFYIADSLQYSLVLDNKAFVQIFFQEIDGEICKGSLSFLPHPDLLMTYFRFDMDKNNWKHYYHNSFHINFGYRTDNNRFSLNRFPFPSEFLRFALFLLGEKEITSFNRNRFFNDLISFGEQHSHLFDFLTV